MKNRQWPLETRNHASPDLARRESLLTQSFETLVSTIESMIRTYLDEPLCLRDKAPWKVSGDGRGQEELRMVLHALSRLLSSPTSDNSNRAKTRALDVSHVHATTRKPQVSTHSRLSQPWSCLWFSTLRKAYGLSLRATHSMNHGERRFKCIADVSVFVEVSA